MNFLAPPSVHSKPRVLLVEDEPGDAALIRWQLTERSADAFEIREVTALREIRDCLEQTPPWLPEVVLLDLNLPDASGAATVERLRAILPEVPVVVLTGNDDPKTINEALNAGAEDYLQKGAEGHQLRKAIRYAMLRYERDANARLATRVFEHAAEGLLVTDANATILDANPAFTRISGYSRDELIGRNPHLLHSGRQDPDFYAAMWRTLLDTGQWRGEIWNRRKNGEEYVQILSITTVSDRAGRPLHYIGACSDISQFKVQEAELKRMAHHDPLTGLPNRRLFSDFLQQAMARTRRGQQILALCFIDLDGFKPINDAYGHDAGDQVLIEVSQRLRSALRGGDSLARIGGDEFILLLCNLDNLRECTRILDRLLSVVGAPIALKQAEVSVGASIGVVLFPEDDSTEEQLLRHADQAMYRAKEAGKNRYHLFDPELDLEVSHQRQLVSEVAQALEREELLLHYLPKVDLQDGQVLGVEALLRWQKPGGMLCEPLSFLPSIAGDAAEQRIGIWVIAQALEQAERWRELGISLALSVNLNAQLLLRADFAKTLAQLLAAHPQLPTGTLELEITEFEELSSVEPALTAIRACRDLGVRFALDDFGAGPSSLSFFRRLPFDELKIEQNLVQGMLENEEDLHIVTGLIQLANALRRKTTAEGVASAAHAERLLTLGCSRMQGYGIARPMPAADLPTWLQDWKARNPPR